MTETLLAETSPDDDVENLTEGAPHIGVDELVEDLVRDHLALVGFAVGEVIGRVPAHVRRDDLVSAGQFALFTAARAFDPGLGVPFASFALRRIRGGLIDELRSMDWASRSVRRRAREVQVTRDALAGALGRAPSESETAESMGVSTGELRAVSGDVARASVLSMQGLGDPDVVSSFVTDSVGGPEGELLERERLGYLRDAVASLPERLGYVVSGYFLEGRTMIEIGRELGVSDSRVSQLCTEALRLMRVGLTAALEPDLVPEPRREPAGCVARRQQTYVDAVATRSDLRSRLTWARVA